ncbi:hypothetical protein N9467_06265 [Litorivicinus sp.]|nr:hypothetical protein [Litorivicinus sp.]
MSKESDAIAQIEESYEYMLAYAAQGRSSEGAGADGASIRNFLDNFMLSANVLENWVSTLTDLNSEVKAEFLRASKLIKGLIDTVLKKTNISSELVDNMNALMATRHYLTLIFFLDKSCLD